ncbi:MAG: large subunit ribosomal protein L31e [Thermoproteota archaeon]|nr:large subunit ribosomal protein L31e [Thermoproteota archaeon]
MTEREADEKKVDSAREKTEEKDENVVEEKVFTIPLKKAWGVPIKKRTPRTVRILKDFMKKNMKSESLILSGEVNEYIWSRGIEGAPRRIRVRAVRDKEDVVKVYLAKGR